MARTPPWKRTNPKTGASHRLTEAQKDAARKRAEQAGRRYPNLVDNMWALKYQGRGKGDTDPS